MKFILILMFYFPGTATIQTVTTAEFDDKAACEAAYGAVATMTLDIGAKNSVRHECLPKSSGASSRR